MKSNKSILVILDGWGHGPDPEVSALAKAHTPFMDSLYSKFPNSELVTYGEEVGLPEGQMGNSEVGHLNIGAGRVVYQELARINKAVKEKTLEKNEQLLAALAYAKENDKAIHLLGLVSDGGVHSHINHLKALCDIISNNNITKTYIHAFMDGRDTAPRGGLGYLHDLQKHIEGSPVKIASIIGRYYAMDRDQRWERIKLAYDLLVHRKGTISQDWDSAIKKSYAADVTDEFLQPVVCSDEQGSAYPGIKEGDVVLFYNYRTDRPRQLTQVLSQKDFPDFDMHKLPLYFVTMNNYNKTFQNIHLLFEKDDLKETLGEVLAKAGKTQVRIAETEKYPHVTFFFSGGREAPFEGERRLLVPSPRVATYDLKPEMSAEEITESIVNDIENNEPDFICLNYANTDMVGHTGDFAAAMKAAEKVDSCLERLIHTALKADYTAIIIADHGNSDFMINKDGSPHTAHTLNPVPCIYVSNNLESVLLKKGKLADVAPTILEILDLEAPASMTGESLLTTTKN
ncbi:MAG: 2,3-bisphosphoglycerate-independent phosphoglycerate mutase [Polaribacter sp.]|jgi:2,3-bisphosphoglycerate-independent phosphoglycerate mutase